ncbi:MAG: energy-coupling factor ABC transporter ATP-binding protein [bacterium]
MAERLPAITIEDLHFTYPDGTIALRGVHLTIYEGEAVALVGRNGSGKSTLIKHLNGIYQADKGKITVDGLPVIEENLQLIRSRIGIVFQDPDNQLFCSTLYDDVAFGPINMDKDRETIGRRVRESLEQVGLWPLAELPPHDLSFGQRKRAAMATVLSMQPRIMIFDEPTSNLDPKNEAVMTDIIANLGCTRILISHDLPILYQVCEKVIIMKEGQIEHILPMQDFISDRELLRANGLDFTFKCDCCSNHDHPSPPDLELRS